MTPETLILVAALMSPDLQEVPEISETPTHWQILKDFSIRHELYAPDIQWYAFRHEVRMASRTFTWAKKLPSLRLAESLPTFEDAKSNYDILLGRIKLLQQEIQHPAFSFRKDQYEMEIQQLEVELEYWRKIKSCRNPEDKVWNYRRSVLKDLLETYQ